MRMKRLIALIMAILVVLTFEVVPQAVYCADEEEGSKLTEEDYKLLTPEEKAFIELTRRKKDSVLSAVYTLSHFRLRLSQGYYNNREDITRTLDWFLQYPPDFCSFQSSGPPIFERYRTEWNSELCPDYVTFYGKVISSLKVALEDPDIMEKSSHSSITIINPRLSDRFIELDKEGRTLGEIAVDVSSEVFDLARELVKERKKLREKAKPLLEEGKKIIKKDAEEKKKNDKNAGSNEDSEDLFDMDCFIATAAYGTRSAEEINILREFRDEYLLDSLPGEIFVNTYYKISPPIANVISEIEIYRLVVKEVFIDPLVYMVELTKPVWN